MQRYTTEQRTKIIELYFENQQSIVLTQRAYCRYFNVRITPTVPTINRLVARFLQEGSVRNLPGTGRPCTAHTDENIQRVRESVQDSPETSTRRRSAQLGLSRRSVQRIFTTLHDSKMVKSATVKLNDGQEMPLLGLGTYARGGSQNKACQLSVEAAISSGYRHIDTAAFYDNEEEVGLGIRHKIADGTVTREELFLTTKLWNDRHETEKVKPSLKESLGRFGLDYVNLFLIHWPVGLKDDGTFSDVDYLETWKGMEECLKLGYTKAIGVSNFNISQLERLLKNSKVVPAVNQIEMNPNLTQKPLLKFCKEHGIQVTAYSPFGSMPESKTSETSPAPRLNDPILTAIAEKYGKSTTQVVLRYLLDCGASAIPKSVTPARIATNIDIFDFHLTADEIAKVDAFNKDHRVVAVPFWKEHKHFPF